MTLKLTLALVMAFITAVIVGKFYVPWLRKMKAGQEIKENGPTWHMSKSGTPTMGGVIFISACTLVCLTVGLNQCAAEILRIYSSCCLHLFSAP